MKTLHVIILLIIISFFYNCNSTASKNEKSEQNDSIPSIDLVKETTEELFNDTLESKENSIPDDLKNYSTSVEPKKGNPEKTVLNPTKPNNNTINATSNSVTEPKPVAVVKVDKEPVVDKTETTVTLESPKEPKVAIDANTTSNTNTSANPTQTSPTTSNWLVPTKDKNLKNPIENNKENFAEAKTLYNLHCKSCHGAKGLGDGTKAKGLKGDLGDFSSAKFHNQTDGELFHKTKVGRLDMPGYAKKLSDEEIWLTVHFMRSLKK